MSKSISPALAVVRVMKGISASTSTRPFAEARTRRKVLICSTVRRMFRGRRALCSNRMGVRPAAALYVMKAMFEAMAMSRSGIRVFMQKLRNTSAAAK